jgi:hypothetical protein
MSFVSLTFPYYFYLLLANEYFGDATTPTGLSSTNFAPGGSAYQIAVFKSS